MNLQTPQSASYRIQALSEAALEVFDPVNGNRVYAGQHGQYSAVRSPKRTSDRSRSTRLCPREARARPASRRRPRARRSLDPLLHARMLRLVEEDRGEGRLAPAADLVVHLREHAVEGRISGSSFSWDRQRAATGAVGPRRR